jgi:tetratricopeptide (TPR) repeat protein
MNKARARHVQVLKCLLVLVFASSYAVLQSARAFVEPAPPRAQYPAAKPERERRFDDIVRGDFFAGMTGDDARLDRGMKFCEEILAKNPKHAEALVWHGGGLLARASRTYAKGDSALGDQLWERGLKEMDDAVRLAPEHMGIKIGRSATIIGLAQSGWDASDPRAVALLESALADYEVVYRWRRPVFSTLSAHSRGELLFGLASGWSILGEHRKAREYLRLVLEECKDTSYEAEARKWIEGAPTAVVQHDCRGCHVGRPR